MSHPTREGSKEDGRSSPWKDLWGVSLAKNDKKKLNHHEDELKRGTKSRRILLRKGNLECLSINKIFMAPIKKFCTIVILELKWSYK